MKTLENYMGDDWTPPVAAAWRETFEHMKTIMLRGADVSIEDMQDAFVVGATVPDGSVSR